MKKSYLRQDLYMNLIETILKMSYTCMPKNEPALERDETVPDDLPGAFYTIQANDIIPDNCKHPLTTIQATQNQKQTNRSFSKIA